MRRLLAALAVAMTATSAPAQEPAAVQTTISCEEIADFLAARAAAIRGRDADELRAPLGPELREYLAGLTKLLDDERFAIAAASSAMHRCDEGTDGARTLHWTMVLRLRRDGNPDSTRHLVGAWIRVERVAGALHAELTDEEAKPPEEHERMESHR